MGVYVLQIAIADSHTDAQGATALFVGPAQILKILLKHILGGFSCVREYRLPCSRMSLGLYKCN